MSAPAIIGLSGSFGTPSKTRVLAEEAVRRAAVRFEQTSEVYDLGQFGPELGLPAASTISARKPAASSIKSCRPRPS